MYIDYHRIQNGFQVTRFSLPFSELVYGLHIRAPLYPCSRSTWADKTSSKSGRATFFSGHRWKRQNAAICVLFLFFVSNDFFFLMPFIDHDIFFFQFVPIVGSLACFFRYHYHYVHIFFQFIIVHEIPAWKRGKRGERARERDPSDSLWISHGFTWTNCLFDVHFCVYVCICIYTHTHIYIYILFFRSLYYIGEFSFTHVIYLYSLKIRFIHRGERADEHRGCEEKKMPIRSEQDETTGRLFSWWWPVETMTPVMTMTMMGGRCEVIVGVQCSTWIARCSRSSMNGWARKWGNRIWLIYIYVFYNITVCVLCQLFDYFIFFYLFSVFDWCFFHVHSSTFS